MFTEEWTNFLTTDCVVYKINDIMIYPIFRNGSHSLRKASQEILYNKDISMCNDIVIMIRESDARFRSGVNVYCSRNNLTVDKAVSMIKKGELFDRHFMPQVLWLLHLYKHYKGDVTLRSFDHITDYTGDHIGRLQLPHTEIPVLEEFTAPDRLLEKYFDKKNNIRNILMECNVLS